MAFRYLLKRSFQALYFFALSLLATSCSNVPQADDGSISCSIEHRINSQVEWRQGGCQDEEIEGFIAAATESELTADMAIQIALLNNPKVQATFEDIGIARADLVEAGLLSNPVFDLELRYPHVKGLKTNIEYLITASLLDIFLVPLRTRLASTEFEQTKLKVSNALLDLAFDVRETYYELVAEIKRLHFISSSVELTSIVRDILAKQIRVGNVNILEFQLAEARFLEAELELSRSQVEVIRLKEKLNRLLGFSDEICLNFPIDLPDVDYFGFDLCALESIALEQRLDLQVARFEIARLSQILGLKDWWAYTNAKVGLAGERDTDGTNVIGPGFSVEIPIFNYGQAARMRLFAELRQAQSKLAELEIRALSEVREAHKVLMNYLTILQDYRVRLLPMQAQISASSEELYNVMGIGVDKLLEHKRQEVVATQNYTENLKKYWVARVELDRSLGGYLFWLLLDCEEKVYP